MSGNTPGDVEKAKEARRNTWVKRDLKDPRSIQDEIGPDGPTGTTRRLTKDGKYVKKM